MDTRPTFRAPTQRDLDALSALARRAKAHWGYPSAWLALWEGELAYTAARLKRERHRVAEAEGALLGVVSLSLGAEAEIEGLWVDPGAMGRGLGRRLMAWAAEEARRAGFASLRIVSDPDAEGFYRRLGARPIGVVPSRPEGRTLPLLHLPLDAGAAPPTPGTAPERRP